MTTLNTQLIILPIKTRRVLCDDLGGIGLWGEMETQREGIYVHRNVEGNL